MNKYQCNDPSCEFCYLTKRPLTKHTPILPQEMLNTINQAGGYYEWRDAILIENSKSFDETKHIKLVVYDRIRRTTRQKVKRIMVL